MTFTEWYKYKFGEEWHEDYGLMIGYAYECSEKYEKYCRENNLEPIWNG